MDSLLPDDHHAVDGVHNKLWAIWLEKVTLFKTVQVFQVTFSRKDMEVNV